MDVNQKASKYKRILIVTLLSLLLLFIFLIKNNNQINKWESEKIIAHAFGRFNNSVYTNSLEALKYWYFERGMRFMEADLHLTSDFHTILTHDYRHLGKKPNLSEFKKLYARGHLTPMTFEDLVIFMEQHPDLYIITDSKFVDIPHIIIEFDEMIRILKRHKNVNKRFIIEVYNEKMFLFLKRKRYPFNNFMFTLYKRWWGKNYKDLENIFSFCAKNKIKGVIMYKQLFNSMINNLSKNYSVPVYLHTENNIQKIVIYLKYVKGIFSDDVSNIDLAEYLKNKSNNNI